MKTKIDKKLALFFEGTITKYIYDYGKQIKDISVMQRGTSIDVFDNETGKIKFVIDDITGFEITNTCIITYGAFVGAYSHNGVRILSSDYSKIRNEGKYFIVTTKDGKNGVYKWEDNILTTIIEPTNFCKISLNQNGIIVYKRSGSKRCMGVYSYNGQEIISPEYKEIHFNDNNIRVITHGNKIGIFSYVGKIIVPPEFLFVDEKGNSYKKRFYIVGKFTSSSTYKYGMYDSEGKQILATAYDYYKINASLIYFGKGFRLCVYSLKDGKRILPLRYEIINKYYEVIYGTENYKDYFIHSIKTGKKLLKEPYDNIINFASHILILSKGSSKFYYLTEYNALLSAKEYDVKYDDEDKKVYVRKKSEDKNWVPYVTE